MKKRNVRWLDAAHEYLRRYGNATGEMLIANVVNADGKPYRGTPNYREAAMWLKADPRFIVLGAHTVQRYPESYGGTVAGGPYEVNLWGIADE